MASTIERQKMRMALDHEIKRLFRKYDKEDIAFSLLQFKINIIKKPEESNQFRSLVNQVMGVD